MSNELFKANLTFFETSYPEVAKTLRAIRNPLSRLVWEDGEAVDIDLGSGRMYKQPVRSLTRQQIDRYFANPERIILNAPEGATLKSPYAIRMFEHFRREVRSQNQGKLLGQSKDVVGFLLVVGIGLGLHIEELIERTKPFEAILIEPIDEFLMQSCHVVDWARIADLCRRHGTKLTFVLGKKPGEISDRIQAAVRASGTYRIDGSYLFTHYPTWVTSQIRNNFKANAPFLVISRGWYEDEVVMLTNASGNYIEHPFRLVLSQPQTKRPEPAIIVASGPSLDSTIEVVKRWKDHAIIFSSGSSLQALLSQGIIPDYHVEIENVPASLEMHQLVLARHKERFPNGRYDGMRLIASATVNPGVPRLFDETYLFLRDSTSSSLTLGRAYRPIYFAAPLVANTSTVLAAVLGFHEIYFFGCDCGMRDINHHHSKATPYYTDERFIKPTTKDIDVKSRYTYPANFGGTVETSILLDWCRRYLEEVVSVYGLNAFNCSDGALIDGAKPKAAESVQFKAPIDKQAIYRSIRETTKPFAAGEFLKDHDLEGYVAQCDSLLAELPDFFDAVEKECPSVELFIDRLSAFMAEARNKYLGPERAISGSVAGIPLIAVFFLNRIEDQEIRRRLYLGFLKEFQQIVTDMCLDTRSLYAKILAHARGTTTKALALQD